MAQCPHCLRVIEYLEGIATNFWQCQWKADWEDNLVQQEFYWRCPFCLGHIFDGLEENERARDFLR